mmetsp:Transcript_22278/g.52966  ORF Transcript_22278/g.52966 Transcript_22278/m.52966 type:complete len:736 (-) Transcript_22278:137-2344(-)
MANLIQIENLPDEMGEEISIANNDDGTISSKILGSTTGKSLHPKTEETTATIVEAESKGENEDSNEGDEKEATEEDVKEAKEEDSENETEEREFDKNPTVLYALVQKKLWKETVARAKTNPEEARAYISRKEKDGRIRWRLLPLHAAIVFKAPEDVIEALLSSYPKAAEAKDDQGMLPLHLAFRNNATEGVVNLILLAYPESVNSPDRKGRVPLTLAKAVASPKRELYIQALEKGPSHYAVTALACARERIIAEQKEMYDSQIENARTSHEAAINEIKAEAEKSEKEIRDVVDEKEKELAKLHDNSQVLVDHVASLEAQMNTRSDTERFLAVKIAKLEDQVRKKDAHIEERESFWALQDSDRAKEAKENQDVQEEERKAFIEEKTKLSATVEKLEGDLNETQKKLKEANDSLRQLQEEFEATSFKAQAKFTEAEMELVNAQANVAIMESQLKKRMENEQLLANQVSNLASRLAESSDTNLQFVQKSKEHNKNVKAFKGEKEKLETTISLLKQRLENVTAVMESTRKQQMSILDDAISQEETMAKCMESHSLMVSDSIQYEKELQEAKEEMMQMIERSLTDANQRRLERFKTVTSHGQSLSRMNASRHNVLSCAQIVTSNVIGALENDLNLDTLSMEVPNQKMIPEETAEQLKVSVNEEVRDEPEDLKKNDEKDQVKSLETEELSATEVETVEVVSSPKKNTVVVDETMTTAGNEQRTKAENVSGADVHVTSVTAE